MSLFTDWATPNCYKNLIVLEETDLSFEPIPEPLNGPQHEPAFTRINPNGKIPAMVDLNPAGQKEEVVVFESGAILIYLAEKTGKFLPKKGKARYEVIQWLMFQMAGVGPMFGQLYHFKNSVETPVPYAEARYKKEVHRLYGVMEERLGEARFLAGEYSIADMAVFPWAKSPELFEVAIEDYPNINRWLAEVGARPAIVEALAKTFK